MEEHNTQAEVPLRTYTKKIDDWVSEADGEAEAAHPVGLVSSKKLQRRQVVKIRIQI